jgi:hypothetical protein
MPRAKSVEARGPARGRSASAACAEVSISVMPPGCSVDAAVRIIAKPTMFEAAIPAIVSKLIRSRAAGPWAG